MPGGIPPLLADLIVEFESNEIKYKSPSFKEQWAREQFIDPLLQILGWERGSVTDLSWDGYISEDRLSTATAVRAPDYGCYYFGRRGFYVEAKAPSVRIEASKPDAFQVRSYGWSADVPLCILTDFEEVAVYDCRTQPTQGDEASVARVRYFSYRDWEANWEWFTSLFGRLAVEQGSLLDWASSNRAEAPSIPVSRAFLGSVERWRTTLAEALANGNTHLSEWELTDATQLLLDRLIFLRIAEARGIETDRTLLGTVEHLDVYSRLIALFGRAENRFNSSLFHFNREDGRPGEPDSLTPGLTVADDVLRKIVRELYPPESPYEFAAIPAEILGEVYEQFLGSKLTLHEGRVEVEQKPEIKNAGGVVYTPAEVVRYMLSKSLSPLLTGSTAITAEGNRRGSHPLRILDPACGSGSFLIQAYEALLRWFLEQYGQDAERWQKGATPRIVNRGGSWALTIGERKRILRDHVFGVDVDHQAVEVTKLSLLLKALEGEDATTLGQQLQLIQDRALPDLSGNIRCGNSLVEPNFMDIDATIGVDEQRTRAVNPFRFHDEFEAVFEDPNPGFDLVIGNPPYVLLQDEFRDEKLNTYYAQNYDVSSYKVDLYHLFIERSLQLTRQGGNTCLIVPSNFMTNNYLRELRRALVDGGLSSVSIVDSAVFARRSVDTAIFLCERTQATRSEIESVRLNVAPSGLKESGKASIRRATVEASPELLLVPSRDEVEQALQTIENSSVTTLGEVAFVNFGKQLRNRKIFTADVIHVDNESEIQPPYKACYTGENLGRYHLAWNGLACLDDPVAQMGGTWNAERQNAQDKLLTKQIGKWPEWAIDTAGRQCLNTIFMVAVREDQMPAHALLTILNSATVRAYWVGRFWDQRRTFPKIKGTYLKRIPLPAPSDQQLADLDAIGHRLVELHEKDTDANRRLRNELMMKAELTVAKLYGLTPTTHAALIDLLK